MDLRSHHPNASGPCSRPTHLDHAAEGLHWVGADGTILWANQTELDLLGYGAEEYIGRHIAEFHVDPPVIQEILVRLKRGETLQHFGARLRHKNGSVRYVQINSRALWHGDKFLRTQCFTRDVTEKRVAEELARRLADPDGAGTDEASCQRRFTPRAHGH